MHIHYYRYGALSKHSTRNRKLLRYCTADIFIIVLGQAHLGSGVFCENLKTMSHICLPVLTSGKKDSNWCLQEKKLKKEISSLWIFTYKFPHSESLLGIPSAFHREQFLHNCREKCVKSALNCSHPLCVTIQFQSALSE